MKSCAIIPESTCFLTGVFHVRCDVSVRSGKSGRSVRLGRSITFSNRGFSRLLRLRFGEDAIFLAQVNAPVRSAGLARRTSSGEHASGCVHARGHFLLVGAGLCACFAFGTYAGGRPRRAAPTSLTAARCRGDPMWSPAQVGQQQPPSRRSGLDLSKQPAGGSCPYS